MARLCPGGDVARLSDGGVGGVGGEALGGRWHRWQILRKDNGNAPVSGEDR